MGFEQTVAQYRDAQKQLAGESPEDQERFRSTVLQKAWADRICESLPEQLGAGEKEDVAIDTMAELGQWFRENVLEFPSKPNTVSRKQYYLDLFDQNPRQAVEELSVLYRLQLH